MKIKDFTDENDAPKVNKAYISVFIHSINKQDLKKC